MTPKYIMLICVASCGFLMVILNFFFDGKLSR